MLDAPGHRYGRDEKRFISLPPPLACGSLACCVLPLAVNPSVLSLSFQIELKRSVLFFPADLAALQLETESRTLLLRCIIASSFFLPMRGFRESEIQCRVSSTSSLPSILRCREVAVSSISCPQRSPKQQSNPQLLHAPMIPL